MLEDETIDVVRKAARGLGKKVPELLDDLGSHAAELNLHFEALRGLSLYQPTVELPAGVTQIVTEWGHVGVNVWLIETEGIRLLFDTGTHGEVVVNAIGKSPIDALFITHNHIDHVGGYESVVKYTDQVYAAGDCGFETHWDHVPQVVSVHGFQVEVFDVTGHATPSGAPIGLAYTFEIKGQPVCVVGDALFAGSMGGCTTPQRYQMALRALNLLKETLPPETIMLCGHGPATTLAQELVNNPFFVDPS